MSGDELTIEQLAAATGMTVRTIRSHVTRGLLPAPILKARTGFYVGEHVRRLELITRLQEQGFNLNSISRLLDRLPDPDLTVGLYQRALGPWMVEPPVEMTVEELAAEFDEEPSETRLTQLREAGVIEVLDGGNVRVLNPALIRVGNQGLSLGFDADSLLDVLSNLMSHSRAISALLVKWFLDTHWAPWEAAGRPPEGLSELTRVIEGVMPMAADGVLAAFHQAMTESVEQAFDYIAQVEIAAVESEAAAVPGTPGAGS